MALQALNDSELVARCLEGDEKAWLALIERYRRLVYSVPLRMGLRVEDADDVFQETFAVALARLATLRDQQRVGLWLAVTARRKALDLTTRGAAAREVALAGEAAAGADTATLPDEALLQLERQALVRAALAQLEPRCRLLLEALYFRDPPASYRELARLLKMPAGSLGPTRQRCVGKLRGLLADSILP